MSFSRLYETLVADIDYGDIEVFLLNHLKKNQAVLDVGCGTGIFSLFLKKQGFDVTGIDSDSEMLAIFEEKQRQVQLNVPIFEHDIRKPLNRKFDQMILLNDVINYFKGIRQVLKNLSNALEKNGQILLDFYKEEYLDVMNSYIEDEEAPVVYRWEIFVNHSQMTHQITHEKQVYRFNQYIYSLSYYLDQFKVAGLNPKLVDGPDERKHYVILTKKDI
ncbi:MAG TPA: hypothetical protein DEA45_00575 [Acholeplasmataceae bacterium]|nr:hypothetical protein [Acholeplasmataceae bacterium]